jgi:hypothetical protein
MILLLAFLMGIASAGAAEPLREWKYRGDVVVPRFKFVAVPLTARDLDLCEKPDLSDVRILDRTGTEVPYALVFERERRTEAELTGTALNRESPNPATTRLTIDFGASLAKNRVTVETAGDNFRRRVQVEGSGDLLNWVSLQGDAWLIAAGSTRERRFESVETGLNTYRYLRVLVSKMAEEPDPPRIDRVTCKHVVVRPPREEIMKSKLLQYKPDGREASTAEVDFGYRHLPVQRLKLNVTKTPDRLYRKSCTVWGRNSLQHPERIRFESGELGQERMIATSWEHVGTGAVFREVSGRESMELALPVSYRYVKIRIEDGDTPPLELSGVEGVLIPAFLVIEPAGQTRFQVYVGNAAAPPVNYQFASLLASLDTRDLQKSTAIGFEPQAAPQAWGPPPGQKLVWIVLALVVAATAWVLWKTARSLDRGGGGDAAAASPSSDRR